MDQSDSKSGNNGFVSTPDDWDVGTIVEQIQCDLNGSVTLSMIQEVLDEVIPKYKSARIQTFVPIFIHRDAVKQLKSLQVPIAAPVTTTHETGAGNGSRAISQSSPDRIDHVKQDKTAVASSIGLKSVALGDLKKTIA